MNPSGNNSDRIADLEESRRQQQSYAGRPDRAKAPDPGVQVWNAVSALPPDASPSDEFEPTARPWVILTNGDDTPRRETAAFRAQTRDGSTIDEADQKLVVYFYAGRWWIVTAGGGDIELVYLGNPDASDPYVEPDPEGNAYDARLVTIPTPGAGNVEFGAEPREVWLMIGQRYDDHGNVTPLPRGLILLASKQGMLTVGESEEEDERPLYYADHWQWLWCQLDLSEATTLQDGQTESAVVLDRDGTATTITITVRNRTGVAIPAAAKIFVDYHAESGEWWIRHAPAGSVVRARVLDATITGAGDVNLWDDATSDWSATATEIMNYSRPLFKYEEILVGMSKSGQWVPLELPTHTLEGTAGAAISKGASGSVTLDEFTDTPSITAWSYLGSIAEGDKVYVVWFKGKWRIIAAECPEEP